MQGVLQINEENFDFGTTLVKDTVSGLLDGQGYVTLMDFSPRIIRKGYTPEALIVKAARTSFAQGLKNPVEDNLLLEYLFYNQHTSPIEMCNVTLTLKLPLFVCTHFLRHRTGKFNQFSQRYSKVEEDMGFYDPTKWSKGIRFQCQSNKQSSNLEENKKDNTIREKLQLAYEYQDKIREIYHSLIKEDSLAKEISRCLLPQSQYTILVMHFDLNNLIKMLSLRDDAGAQLETQEYARAIEELCTPLFPTIFAAYRNRKNGVFLMGDEVEAFKNATPLLTGSKRRQLAYTQKEKRLRRE
jgi:thymidylate synthase (FAD)